MEKIKSVDLLNFKEQLENFMIYEIENNYRSKYNCKHPCDSTCEDESRVVLYRVNSLIDEIYEKEKNDYE